MWSTFVDHPSFTALVGAITALILKIFYDKYWAKGSRITADIFMAYSKNMDRRIMDRNAIVDRRFEEILSGCKDNQKKCSDIMCDRITMSSKLFMKQMEEYSCRLNNGDEIFKSHGHTQRAMVLTLLAMCHKMEIDCDELTKTFVQEDLLK